VKETKTKHLDELFNEADLLMNKCKNNFEEINKSVEELKSMQGDYLNNIENMLLFKVKERAYDLLNDAKENKLYN
jgi:peptidoglycan hydrolase CwlO-like protein